MVWLHLIQKIYFLLTHQLVTLNYQYLILFFDIPLFLIDFVLSNNYEFLVIGCVQLDFQ